MSEDDKLQDAAANWMRSEWSESTIDRIGDSLTQAFYAGANWQKEQEDPDRYDTAYTDGVCDGLADEQERQAKRVCGECKHDDENAWTCKAGVRRASDTDTDFGCSLFESREE